MKIIKLIVRRTEPSKKIIREILFNQNGLNLIIDNTPENIIKTGNSVGKSTTIKIIDLCLGAKSLRNIYYDSDTGTENTDVKKFLDKYKVQAELILADKEGKTHSIKRDLFSRGKKYIADKSYNEHEFGAELKKLFFNLNEPKPTFRQLIPKFVRLENISEEKMIKFLPMGASSDDYDAIYCFLFQIYNEKLISKKNELLKQIANCEKTTQALEQSKSITSLSLLKQSLEIINNDLTDLYDKRQQTSYIETYKNELDTKRQLTLRINNLQEQMELLEFEVDNMQQSIDGLLKEKKDIDFNTLKAIYTEAQTYIPNLHKSFKEMVEFHNTMIQNRIDFINDQLNANKELLAQYSEMLSELIKEKEKITIEVLDEGLLDELNILNNKIEDLSLKKGEIQQSIFLLEEQRQIHQNLDEKLYDIEKQMDKEKTEDKIKIFNQIFSAYCEKLYGEKYLLDYNENWKEEKKFPVTIGAIQGNVGTGKKKAVIVAYDLAYMQYSIKTGIDVPQFVIHDRMESTHINQLKTIFDICNNIEGQYIIPILRERIDKIDQDLIKKSVILELSSADKFFRI